MNLWCLHHGIDGRVSLNGVWPLYAKCVLANMAVAEGSPWKIFTFCDLISFVVVDVDVFVKMETRLGLWIDQLNRFLNVLTSAVYTKSFPDSFLSCAR